MRHRTVRAIPALVTALAVAIAVGGCSAATATPRAASAGTASAGSAAASSATPTSVPVDGPFGPDSACVAALKAEATLQARQGKDQNNESALDQDFTNFANALNADARRETRPATAKAMTTLASDFTDLVESQTGTAQLPDMSTVQSDGAAFDKACSNS